jgi:hypothetical protein
MKKRHVSSRTLKQLFLAVPAAALMLGASQAQTTVGLNFQAWYYDSGTSPQTVGFGAGYQTTGFPVTATAFGVAPENWSNPDPLDANFVSISTNVPFDGTLTAQLTAPGAWQSGIGELVAGFSHTDPERVAPGNNEVTWGYLNDAIGSAPSVSVSGLAGKFPHGYVVQTIAAVSGVTTFDGVDITDGTNDSSVAYSTYYVANPASDGFVVGGTVGLSAPSGVFNSDTISINCQPRVGSTDRSTLAGFIITDKPVVSQDPPGGAFALGNSFILSAGVVGLPPLGYQWRSNGVPIPGATSAAYTNASAALTDGGSYDLVVTNLYGAATSGEATVVVLFPYPAQTVTWDADPATAGAQDGNGTWNFTPAQWLIGSTDETWWTNDAAEFGVGGAGPYTVTLAADMVASAVTFNSGNYTITNTSGQSLTLQGTPTITANGAGTISAPLSNGTNTFLKAGAGTLTIAAGGLTCGQTIVSAGTLEVRAKTGDSPYVISNGATLKIGYSTGGGYANTGMQVYGDGTSATTGLYLAGGTTYNVSGSGNGTIATFTLLGAPTTIRQYGSGLAALGTFDINGTGLLCTSGASGSVIAANVQIVSDGYGMSAEVDAGANTATGDLIVNGPLNIVVSGDGHYGFVKRGTGSLRLNGTATATNCALEILAGSVICGIDQCIGPNASLEIDAGATLYFNGTSQTVSNVLTHAGAAGMAGTLSMSINKGGMPSSTVLTEDDGNPIVFGGNLTVTNIGGALVLGDTFTLFSASGAYGGSFDNMTLPTLSDGLGWQNNLTVDGTIQVITGSVPPSIVNDLSGTTNYAYVGGGATYTITAAGDPTLRYHWMHNGTTPVGSDSPTLTLTSVTVADAGYYSVIVTNDYGSAGSQSNYLTVVPTSGYDALIAAAGPLAFWPLNEVSGTTAFDLWSGHDATYVGGSTLDQATNPVTGTASVQFDGASGYALAPYAAALNPAVFSAEAWVNPNAVPTSEFSVLSCGQFASSGRSGWLIYQFPGYWNFRTYYGNGTATAVSLNGITVPVLGSWTHLAATWDGTTARLYVNGTLEGSQVPTTSPKYLPGASGGFCVGARADVSFYWGGNASDAVLYNRVLTAQEISAHAHNQPLLGIAPAGTNVVLTWPGGTGTVQGSPTLTGAFTNVPGAPTSPWTNSPSGQSMFYRLKF